MSTVSNNTKGLYCWIGFKKKEILFEPAPRVAGESHFSYRKLFKLAVRGITSFTTFPLKLSVVTVSLVSFILLIVLIVKALLSGNLVAGYPTLITVILLLGGIQLMCLGILGEYIGLIFNETKRRPVYIVGETNLLHAPVEDE